MEAEGDSERPNGNEYLSVHCDISQLVLCLPSEAQQLPVRGFLQTPKTNWNSLLTRTRWLPDFAWRRWRPVQGGLCGNNGSENAPAVSG